MLEDITTPVKLVPTALADGQELDQPKFHELYEAMPPGTRAELIDGVVYLPRPVGEEHSRAYVPVLVWLDCYAERTAGVTSLAGATIIIGPKSELQPDALLRILTENGGQTRRKAGYLHGAPELVVEVSRATLPIDLGAKLRDYERHGVLEYVVRAIDPDEIYWFSREHDEFVRRSVDADGLYRSTAFPGLWLDPAALLTGDRRRLRTIVDRGRATAEHAAFIARLAAIAVNNPPALSPS